jgi:hypothetical protein
MLANIYDAPDTVPAELSTSLELDVIERYIKARVSSIRFNESPGLRLLKYEQPIELSDAPHSQTISAISLYLCENLGSATESLISLFSGNQFYVANCAPDFVGEVAHQICPLWGFTEE